MWPHLAWHQKFTNCGYQVIVAPKKNTGERKRAGYRGFLLPAKARSQARGLGLGTFQGSGRGAGGVVGRLPNMAVMTGGVTEKVC